MAFEVRAALGHPHGAARDAGLLHEGAQLAEDGWVVAERGVGMEVEDVGILRRVVRVEARVVGGARRVADGAGEDGHRGPRGLEAEVGGLEGGHVVPDGLGGEGDVLLVPELPVAHAVAEGGGGVAAEGVEGGEVAGKLLDAVHVVRHVVEHARDADAACAQHVRVVHVMGIVVDAGTRVHLGVGGAQAFAHVGEAGAPEEVAHEAVGVAAVPGAFEAAGARDPALRGVDAVEGGIVAHAALGHRHDGEGGVRARTLQVVVADGTFPERGASVWREGAGGQGAPAPVRERPRRPGGAAPRGCPLPVRVDVPRRVKGQLRLPCQQDARHQREEDCLHGR